MKEKIIIFVIGLLAGAVISTGAFTAFTLLTNNCHRTGMNNKNMPMIQNNNGQPQMNNNNGNNSNNNQPPEMPNNNQQPTEQNNQ